MAYNQWMNDTVFENPQEMQTNESDIEMEQLNNTKESLHKFGFNDIFNVVAYSVMSVGELNVTDEISIEIQHFLAGIILNSLVLVTAYNKSSSGEITWVNISLISNLRFDYWCYSKIFDLFQHSFFFK